MNVIHGQLNNSPEILNLISNAIGEIHATHIQNLSYRVWADGAQLSTTKSQVVRIALYGNPSHTPLQPSRVSEPTSLLSPMSLKRKPKPSENATVPNAAYTDYQEMIEKEKPDILCLATRPGPHADITVFAAENNVKGIYCEKPLCCSMEEADIMVNIVEKHGVKFNYGTQRRYMPIYRKVRELVDAGEIGDVQCTIAQYGASSALWGLNPRRRYAPLPRWRPRGRFRARHGCL